MSDTRGRKADVGVSRTKIVYIIVLPWTNQFHLDLYVSILYVSQTVNMWFKGEFRIIIISILNPSIEHCFNGDRIYAFVSRFYIKVHLHQF